MPLTRSSEQRQLECDHSSGDAATCLLRRPYNLLVRPRHETETLPDCCWSRASLSEKSAAGREFSRCRFSPLLHYLGYRSAETGIGDARGVASCILCTSCTAGTHGVFGMEAMAQRRSRCLSGIFLDVSRNTLRCAKGLRRTTKGSVLMTILSGFNHTVWREIAWRNQSITRDMQPCCRESFKTFEYLSNPNWLMSVKLKGCMENNLNNKMQIITTLVSFPSRLNPEAKMAQCFARGL